MHNNEMKCIVVNKPGGYDSLTISSKPAPNKSDDQYIVDVRFIGVNYADIIVREGYYTAAKGKYPLVPGFEYSGIVTSRGKNCTSFDVGDEVCGVTLFGGYSTQIAASENSLRRIPSGWSLKEAAALLVPNLTAYHGLRNVAHAQAGERVLVHSAAGGVGMALVQQCADLGCRVVGIVGNKEKVGTVSDANADEVIVRSDRLWDEIDDRCPEGFDVVFDANGLTTPKPGYKRLRLGGRLIIYGFAELFPKGGRPFLPSLIWKALRIPKFRIRNMTSTNRTIAGFNIAFLVEKNELAKPALDYILERASSGKIKPPQITAFGFSEVVNAHKYLESGNSIGRIVLEVSD